MVWAKARSRAVRWAFGSADRGPVAETTNGADDALGLTAIASPFAREAGRSRIDDDDRYRTGVGGLVGAVGQAVRGLSLGKVPAHAVLLDYLRGAVIALAEDIGAFVLIAHAALDAAIAVDLDLDHEGAISTRGIIILSFRGFVDFLMADVGRPK